MKARLILVAIFLGVVYLSMHSSSNPAATDDKKSKAMLYLSCVGFSTSAAAKALKAADGDAKKVLTMAHTAVGGELSVEPPLSAREKICRKSGGL
jgi:hypothetical protein